MTGHTHTHTHTHPHTHSHAYTHTHTHTHTHLYVLYLYLPLPELATWLHSGGEPAGGTKTGDPVGSGDTSFISTSAWSLQCIGVLIYGLARPTR